MSDKSINVKKNPLSNKIKKLKDIRHEIKKKRVIFDENKEKFGLDEFSQLTKVKNTSEIKGYPFRGKKLKYTDIQFGIKIVPIETKYEKHEHPCNLENLVLKELTDKLVNTNISPHITYYLGTQKISNKSKALKMLNLKRLEVEDKIRTHSNMLISEFVEGGSLDNWVFDVYENDKEIDDNQWKSIVFQLIYTIFIIQRYYKMMHNDFHYGNILIDNSIKGSGYLVYEIDNKLYYIKNTGIIPKLWDFEFCMVYSNNIKDCYANKFIIGSYEYDKKLHKTIIDENDSDSALNSDDLNVPFNYNEVYDIHYFLTSLLDLYISQELFDWIIGLYPRELIPDEENSTSDNSTSDNSTSDNSTSDNSTSGSSNNTSLVDKESLIEKISKLSVNRKKSLTNSDSISSLNTNTNTLNSSSSSNKYLSDGRLINGIENTFKLPTPIDLIRHNFFNELTIKPKDFDENDAIYFRAGF
jgi:hypothetical protein